MFGKSSSKPNPIDSLIGGGSVIIGDVNFTGGLRVDGHIRGHVRAIGNKASTLVLSETGKVEGAIDVAHVVINGTVAGPVAASEYVELLPKARVTGDVTYKTIEIHVGAIVMGQLVHKEKIGQDKVVEFKSAAGKSD
jgi:cytoskeletal protein CcmA (bactofilin family)